MLLETRCGIEGNWGPSFLIPPFFAHIENGFAIGSACAGLYRLQLLLYSLMDLTYVWEDRREPREPSIYMTAAISLDAVTAEDEKKFTLYATAYRLSCISYNLLLLDFHTHKRKTEKKYPLVLHRVPSFFLSQDKVCGGMNVS